MVSVNSMTAHLSRLNGDVERSHLRFGSMCFKAETQRREEEKKTKQE